MIKVLFIFRKCFLYEKIRMCWLCTSINSKLDLQPNFLGDSMQSIPSLEVLKVTDHHKYYTSHVVKGNSKAFNSAWIDMHQGGTMLDGVGTKYKVWFS